MKKLRICSLFSGIGGFETGIFHALEKKNCEVVFASEIDKHASRSYEIVYGHAPHGDVTKVDEKDVPDHDLLVGGFPCQAFSVAGKRLGFLDETRGTLFFEIARIAKEKKTPLLLLENVKGLVGHDDGRTLDTIVTTLNEIGYAVDFEVLNSKFYVPQNRERIFIIAALNVEHEEWNIPKGNNDVVSKGKRRISQIEGVKTFNFEWPEQEHVLTKMKDILERDVDEKFYLDESKTKKLLEQLNDRMIKPREVAKDNEIKVVGKLDMKGNDTIRRVYDPEGIAPTLTTMGGGYREPKIIENAMEYEVRAVLTPEREEKRQNGRRFKEDGEPAFTLTAQDRNGVAIGKYPNYRIRKLTPLECFRLQGMPEEYYVKLVDAGVSASQLYKMAGNAVTTNVICEIVKKMNTRFNLI